MKKSIKITIKVEEARRNPLHNHPLLKKGGTHEKPYKTLRNQQKQNIKKDYGF